MKQTKLLPILAVLLCVPGIVLRALHLLNGFDSVSGLPTEGIWLWLCVALFVVCAVGYAVLSAPLRAYRKVRFEQLLGTQQVDFRMMMVMAGLLMVLAGGGYLFLSLTVLEEGMAAWARILEFVYAGVTVLTGLGAVSLAKAQGAEIVSTTARLTLLPLLWSCLHLLVNYRMTCIDPNLPSFGFGLVGDIMLVLTMYHLARMLYGKPRPEKLALCGALAITMAVSDAAGYGLAYLMGVHGVAWPAKMVVRSVLSAIAAVLVFAELRVLCAAQPQETDAEEVV